LVKMREVILDSGTKIRYDGHAFSAARPGGAAAKLSPPGRVFPFWQNERPSLPDFAPGGQPRPARSRWPPGDWPSPGTPCPDPTQRLQVTKRPPKMDDLTRDADLDHHLFRPNSYGSRPFYAAAYSRQRRQVYFQRRPKRKARTADEDDGPRDRSAAAIASLKCPNAVLPGTGQPERLAHHATRESQPQLDRVQDVQAASRWRIRINV
jgi:hypothetical protein